LWKLGRWNDLKVLGIKIFVGDQRLVVMKMLVIL
jgi:hypothetical protein